MRSKSFANETAQRTSSSYGLKGAVRFFANESSVRAVNTIIDVSTIRVKKAKFQSIKKLLNGVLLTYVVQIPEF